MSDWLVEEGIGEHRAVRLAGGRIEEARIEWPGTVQPGWVIDARLAARTQGSTRGTAVAEDSGEEILVDRLPRGIAEGAGVRLAITRSALAGPGRLKRAQGRICAEPLAQPSLAERLDAKLVRRFPPCDWDELIGEALDGRVDFAGGTLLFQPTAAMTTVDVDGEAPPPSLALASVNPLADTLRRFGLSGSIGVDFPTLSAKEDRRAVDAALERALSDWPHERTAMNGFGLVQIVARMEQPSLLHLAAWQRRSLVWRQLLRRAEQLEGPGSIALSLHPALEPAIHSDHITALERRTGKNVVIRMADQQAPDAPHAQLTPHG